LQIDIIKKSFTGAGGGPSAFTGEHVKDVLEYQGVAPALLRLFTRLIDGDFPAWAHPYICTQRLTSLGVKERPVCVAEWLDSIASKLCEATVTEEADRAFFLEQDTEDEYCVLQFGNSVRGGQEAAFLLVNGLVHEKGKNRIVIAKDGEAAYQHTDRDYAVTAANRQFPTIARWTTWKYGTSSLLQVAPEEGMHVWGHTGVYQGCPLGGRLHDTALQLALMQAAKASTERAREGLDTHTPTEKIYIIAFRDDVHVVCTTQRAIDTSKLIDETRERLTGVTEAAHKTLAYVPRSAAKNDEDHEHALTALRDESSNIAHDKITTQGFRMLGGPVGDGEFIGDFLNDSTHKYPLFMPRLTKMDKQCALLLLRDCLLPIATHLIRMIHPEHTQPHARELDTQIRETYTEITDDTNINLHAHHASFKHSGMGFRSIEATAPIAHYASTVQSINTINWIDGSIMVSLSHHLSQAPPDTPPPPPEPPNSDDVNRPNPPDSPEQDTRTPLSQAPTPLSQAQTQTQEEASALNPTAPLQLIPAEGQARNTSPVNSIPTAPSQPLSAEESNNATNTHNATAAAASLSPSLPSLFLAPVGHWAIDILSKAWKSAFDSAPELHDLEQIDSLLPLSHDALLHDLHNDDLCTYKLQHALTKQLEHLRDEQHTRGLRVGARTRAEATRTPGANAAFLCTPTNPDTTLPPAAVQFAVAYRTGTLQLPKRACACGFPCITPAHVLSCKKMRGRFVRHDTLVVLLKQAAARAGIVASIEVMVLENSQRRMDLVLHLPAGRVWVDASVVNPQAPSYIKKGAAAARQEREKAKCTSWLSSKRGQNIKFMPFVVDTFGGLGDSAMAVLEIIAKQAYYSSPLPVFVDPAAWQGKYRRAIIEKISITVAHANSCMIEEALIKARRPEAKSTGIYSGLLSKMQAGRAE
jgi:hypothetical protein